MPISSDVFSQHFARRPFRHELRGVEGDTLEGHNIRVIEVLPHHGLPTKCLQNSSGRDDLAKDCEDEIPVESALARSRRSAEAF